MDTAASSRRRNGVQCTQSQTGGNADDEVLVWQHDGLQDRSSHRFFNRPRRSVVNRRFQSTEERSGKALNRWSVLWPRMVGPELRCCL
jgi:hypothetical protein